MLFRSPLHSDVIEEVTLHSERFEVTPENRDRMDRATRRIGVGTTSVRTMETLARGKTAGETNLFLYPGVEFLATGAMLTNFHLPQSSLLVLVCAFAGRDVTLEAYRHAVEQKYRFFSYGDCMLIL